MRRLITRKSHFFRESSMAHNSSAGEGGQLSDGSRCLSYGCFACCVETEMPLTVDDLKRIERLGFKRIDFAVEAEGETRLKNSGEMCFFLKENKCRIYENRPEGCRTYPLVYDVDSHKFIFDPVCPHRTEFKATRVDKDRLKRLLHRLDRRS